MKQFTAVHIQYVDSVGWLMGRISNQPSVLSGLVNEYRLRLGRYKAGMCDAAGARHVPERLCGGGCLQRGAVTSVQPLPFYIWPIQIYATTVLKSLLCTFCMASLSWRKSRKNGLHLTLINSVND